MLALPSLHAAHAQCLGRRPVLQRPLRTSMPAPAALRQAHKQERRGGLAVAAAAGSRDSASSSSSDGWVSRRSLKDELLTVVDRMGLAAILPGSPEDKARVDKLLDQLQSNDMTIHLRSDRPVSSGRGGAEPVLDPRLFGTWQLLYASNGTAVTRTGIAQAMIGASQALPGVGVTDIRQTLSMDATGGIVTTNEAVFGFGPLGSWALAIDGTWKNMGDGRSVKVAFERFKVKPVGLLGLELPSWLPQVLISLGEASSARNGADWETTYLDDELRIGRGKSGNTFLFRRIKDPNQP